MHYPTYVKKLKKSTNVIVSNLSRDNILFSTFYTGLFLLFRKKTGGALPLLRHCMTSLSLQELSIVGSCVKRVCGSQQVGKSPSSCQHSTLRRKRVYHESVESSRICLFVEGDQRHNQNPPQFRPIASKNNITTLQHVP